MFKFFRRFGACLFAACIVGVSFGAVPLVQRQLTPAESEFEHTKLIYMGYVGQTDAQQINMLKLTFERLERTVKMHKDSRVNNQAFVRDMEDFNISLFAAQHLLRARIASNSKDSLGFIKEMRTACRFVDAGNKYVADLVGPCSKLRESDSKNRT